MDRFIRLFGAAALAAALTGALASAAFAHAHYARSQPSPGQVLSASPLKIDIYTDSEMRKAAGGNFITVTGPQGNRVDDGNPALDDADRQHLSVGLTPDLPNGRYLVSFQTLSDVDGDLDHGQFAFYIGAGPTPDQQRLDSTLTLTDTPPPEASTPLKSGVALASRPLIIAGVIALLVVLIALVAAVLLLRGPRHPR
jgi:copper resistance protein C